MSTQDPTPPIHPAALRAELCTRLATERDPAIRAILLMLLDLMSLFARFLATRAHPAARHTAQAAIRRAAALGHALAAAPGTRAAAAIPLAIPARARPRHARASARLLC